MGKDGAAQYLALIRFACGIGPNGLEYKCLGFKLQSGANNLQLVALFIDEIFLLNSERITNDFSRWIRKQSSHVCCVNWKRLIRKSNISIFTDVVLFRKIVLCSQKVVCEFFYVSLTLCF